MSALFLDRVRITQADDGSTSECSLREFFAANPGVLDDAEVEALHAGDRVAVGGGAQPTVHVELIGAKS